MKNLFNKRMIAYLLVVIVSACNSSSNPITVVQNGIGIVQNGIGSISAENMGTVIYDVAKDAVSSSESSGSSTVPGRLSGEAEVVKGASDNQVVIRFKDYRTREAYPSFKSGSITLNMKEAGIEPIETQSSSASSESVASSTVAEEVDSELVALKAKVQSSDLAVGEGSLEVDIDYDLSVNEQGYLVGSMKGEVKTSEKTYDIDQPYDAPIILRLEINQEKVEPGQQLQSQIVIASNTPMDKISLDIVAETEGVREAWSGVEADYEDENVFDQPFPGLWTYESDEPVDSEVPIGKVSFSNIQFVNKAGLASERRANDTINLEVVPVGSGVEQSYLPALSELLAGLAGEGPGTYGLQAAPEEEGPLMALQTPPLEDPGFIRALERIYNSGSDEAVEYSFPDRAYGNPFVHGSYIFAWVQGAHYDRDLLIYNSYLDEVVAYEPNVGGEFAFQSIISSDGETLVLSDYAYRSRLGEKTFEALNLATGKALAAHFRNLEIYAYTKVLDGEIPVPSTDQVELVSYELDPESRDRVLVTVRWSRSLNEEEEVISEPGEKVFSERIIDLFYEGYDYDEGGISSYEGD